MRTKASIDIHSYWDRLRGAEAGPLRSDLEPASIRHILPDLFILERNGSDGLTFRLAGTRMCSLFDRELRQSDFSDLWQSADAAAAERIAVDAMRARQPVLLDVFGKGQWGDEAALELMLLPMRSQDQEYDRLLGALSPVASDGMVFDGAVRSLALGSCDSLPGKSGTPWSLLADTSLDLARGYFRFERKVHDVIQSIRHSRIRRHDPFS